MILFTMSRYSATEAASSSSSCFTNRASTYEAMSAYDHAMSAYNHATSAYDHATSAFDHATSAYGHVIFVPEGSITAYSHAMSAEDCHVSRRHAMSAPPVSIPGESFIKIRFVWTLMLTSMPFCYEAG